MIFDWKRLDIKSKYKIYPIETGCCRFWQNLPEMRQVKPGVVKRNRKIRLAFWLMGVNGTGMEIVSFLKAKPTRCHT